MHRTSSFLILFLAAAACAPLPAERLDEVRIPPDFHFETTRAASVEVVVAPSRRAAGGPLTVEIRKPDGGLVFHGRVGEASAWKASARLALPKYVTSVQVRLKGEGVDETVTLPVDADGAAAHTFG